MLLLSKARRKSQKVNRNDKKLILDFYDKERYVIYHEMLKFYQK